MGASSAQLVYVKFMVSGFCRTTIAFLPFMDCDDQQYKNFLEVELGETQELVSLLAKRAVSDLTEEEQRKVG